MSGVDVPVVGLDHGLAGIVRRHASQRPDLPALTLGTRTLTFAELDARSSHVATTLASEGIGHGDRIAFLDRNSVEYFETLLGCAKIGAVTVAVNWRLAPPELAAVINDAEASVVIMAHEFAAMLDTIAAELRTVRKVVVIGAHSSHVSYDTWSQAGESEAPTVRPHSHDDVALQLYTSGTTGRPKGVMLTNANLAAFLPVVADSWGFDECTVNLVAMPLFHIGGTGYALVGMYVGGHTVLMREFDAGMMLTTIEKHRVTNLFAVPSVLQFLLAAEEVADTDVSSLRMILYGGSPISPDVLRRSIETFRCDFAQAYGLTETTGAIVTLPPADHVLHSSTSHRLNAAGRPLPGVDLRIADPETGHSKATGEVGEVWARTEQRMKGYWNQPVETAAVITADGWVRTGDAGYLDADGYLYIHDRVKDMIVTGGENVYPTEVENVLVEHSAVADVCVVGVPSEKWGETVKALVVPAGAAPTEREIIDWARERLAAFKCPTSVEFRDALPRNASAKVLRRQLREEFWRGHHRRVG